MAWMIFIHSSIYSFFQKCYECGSSVRVKETQMSVFFLYKWVCFSFIVRTFFGCKCRNYTQIAQAKKGNLSVPMLKSPGVVLASGTAGSSAQTNAFGISHHLGSHSLWLALPSGRLSPQKGFPSWSWTPVTPGLHPSYRPASPKEGELLFSKSSASNLGLTPTGQSQTHLWTNI